MGDEPQPGNQPVGEVNGQQAEGEAQVTPEVDVAKLKAEKELIEKRYSDSSREAKRLYEENAKMKAQMEAAQANSSLKQADGLPDKNQLAQGLVERFGVDERLAQFLAEDKLAVANELRSIKEYNNTIVNFVKYNQQQMNSGLISLDPVAQKADEFCKGIPELEALPIPEKINRYKALMEKSGQTITGRDLSDVKRSMGGVTGGTSVPRNNPVSDADIEGAKALGMPLAAYKEYKTVQSVEDNAAFMRKWGKQINL